MSQVFFSIIIPALNEEKLLPKLLSDLANQTFTDFDVTVVDGRSEDKTPEIVRTLAAKDKRFKLLISDKRNVGYQRNLGGHKSKGRYLLFLDADSSIHPTFLQQLYIRLTKASTDAFTCFAEPDTKDMASHLFVTLQNLTHEISALVGTPYAVGACLGCGRSVFNQSGGFNPTIHHMEDSEFVKRLTKLGFTYRVYKKPTFIFSLRRQRKEGTLALLAKLFPYYIHNLLTHTYVTPPEAYPMEGGQTFTSKRQTTHPKYMK